MKVADIKLSWKRSPSSDADKVRVIVTIDGNDTTSEFGPEVEEMMVVVNANQSCQFKVITYDSEGNQTISLVYSFTLGDLEAPLPATNLKHEIINVRDVDNPPEPTPPQQSHRNRR